MTVARQRWLFGPKDLVYLFLLDAVAKTPGKAEASGQVLIWVNSTALPEAEGAARAFAASQGIIVQAIRSAHQPTDEELGQMSVVELAARGVALRDGVGGYFVRGLPNSDGR